MPTRSSAQGLVEYAVILSMLAVMAIGGLVVLGPSLAALFGGLAFLGGPGPWAQRP